MTEHEDKHGHAVNSKHHVKKEAKKKAREEKRVARAEKRAEKENAGHKSVFVEFKEFISRGNIIQLAIGVIIAGAFTAVINALVQKIIMPVITMALPGGMEGLVTKLGDPKPDPTDATKVIQNQIEWGVFINAVITFLLVALILFIILKVYNLLHAQAMRVKEALEKKNKVKEVPPPPPPASNDDLLKVLTEIRDSINKNDKPK